MSDAMGAVPGPRREYLIDHLAQAAGTTVRNVRAYQDRGLLPRADRRGRANVYDDTHLERLRLIAGLLDRGHTLAGIKELLDAWEDGRSLGGVLGLVAEVTAPWSDEQPEYVERAELTARFGGLRDPEAIEAAVRLGVLVPEPGPDPAQAKPRPELDSAGVAGASSGRGSSGVAGASLGSGSSGVAGASLGSGSAGVAAASLGPGSAAVAGAPVAPRPAGVAAASLGPGPIGVAGATFGSGSAGVAAASLGPGSAAVAGAPVAPRPAGVAAASLGPGPIGVAESPLGSGSAGVAETPLGPGSAGGPESPGPAGVAGAQLGLGPAGVAEAGREPGPEPGPEPGSGAVSMAATIALPTQSQGTALERAGCQDGFAARYRVPSPALLDAAARLYELGVPLAASIAHLQEVRTDMEHLARRFVHFAAIEVFPRYVGAPPLDDADAARAADAVRRLRPLAQAVVDAELARAMRSEATLLLEASVASLPEPVRAALAEEL